MYTCTYCSYSTQNQSNYRRHIETSRHKKIIEHLEKQLPINNNPLILIITRLEESNKELQKNYNNLQDRMSVLEKSLANKKDSRQINNYTTNIGTVNNQVNIQIENFGNESIEHIKDTQKIDILNSPNMALRSLLEYVHFNTNKPEFQNIKWTNMQKPLILTKRGDGIDGWSLDNRDETLEELTRNLVNFMDEIRDEYECNNIYNNRTNEEKINDLIQIMNTADDELSDPEKKHKKQVINKLGVHLYQCTKAQKNKTK
jgi:hypothetical protein